MSGILYLLDTNILVHAVRGDALWQEVKARYDPLNSLPRPVFSVVSEAELGSLAEQWSWGTAKRTQMHYLSYPAERLVPTPR